MFLCHSCSAAVASHYQSFKFAMLNKSSGFTFFCPFILQSLLLTLPCISLPVSKGPKFQRKTHM